MKTISEYKNEIQRLSGQLCIADDLDWVKTPFTVHITENEAATNVHWVSTILPTVKKLSADEQEEIRTAHSIELFLQPEIKTVYELETILARCKNSTEKAKDVINQLNQIVDTVSNIYLKPEIWKFNLITGKYDIFIKTDNPRSLRDYINDFHLCRYDTKRMGNSFKKMEFRVSLQHETEGEYDFSFENYSEIF